jgi:hypothetical protein
MVGTLVNNELERIYEEAVADYLDNIPASGWKD